MKKEIKNLMCLLMFALVCIGMTSCSNEGGEPRKIVLDKGESSKLTMAANTASGSVDFTAEAPWSAYTSTQSRSTDEVGWIHLNITRGEAGEFSLTFTLDRNDTGKNRTGYIIIVCEDEKLVITVTQTTEFDEDEDPQPCAPSGSVEIEKQSYRLSLGEAYDEGVINYHFRYNDDRLVDVVVRWIDEIVALIGSPAVADTYCENNERIRFNYVGESVEVDDTNYISYYPSQRNETENYGQHYAEMKNDKAVKGWYKEKSEYSSKSNWEATYNDEGYLASMKYQGLSTQEWNECTYTWKEGCVEKIVWKDGRKVVFEYSDTELQNLHRTFDLNWVLPTEFRRYKEAAGDEARIFVVAGLMGVPSRLLLTAITDYDKEGQTYSYRMDYKVNTKSTTVVTVTGYRNDMEDSYSEWTINYMNIR